MPSRILHNDMDLSAWERFLRAQPFPMTVSQTKGARRSNPQNSLLHKWCAQIAAETGDTPAEVKALCKLRYGLPILERDDPAWVARWHPLYGPLPYPLRLRLFECIPVSSVMSTRQLGEMMDAMQREYLAQGVPLADPDALRYAGEFSQ